MSWIVEAGAGLVCDNSAVLREKIKIHPVTEE